MGKVLRTSTKVDAPILGDVFQGSELVYVAGSGGGDTKYSNFVKRGADILIASTMILAFLPMALFIMAYLWIGAGVSPFFRHARVGQDGRMFKCFKFRTMFMDAQERLTQILESDEELRREWEETQKLKNDPRVIPGVGSLLRKSSLDELPQLINVLKGDMSIVGPRPVTSEELSRYGQFARQYKSVKPGITGVWQIGGRSNTSFEKRVQMDVWYVQNASLKLDLQIFFKTAFSFLSGRLSGAV